MDTTSLENLVNIEYLSSPLSIEYTEDSMLISVLGDTIITTESIEENFSIGYTELFNNVVFKDGDSYNVSYLSPLNFKVYQSEEVVNIFVNQGCGGGGIPITLENHIPGLGILGNNYNGSTEQTWNLAFSGTGVANTVARSDHNHSGVYLTEESDPTVPSYVKAIIQSEIFSWNLVYSWGNHAEAGYLTEETDPIFLDSPAFSITLQDIINWGEAFSWGDHSLVGYLLSETDPIFTSHTVYNIVNGTGFLKNDGVGNWFYDANEYLTEFIEEDPVAMAVIGDRQYSEENHVTSGDTITKSIDDLDIAIDEFTGNTEILPTEELPTEELPYPITANNYESLRYDETAGEWVASNVLLIKEDKVGIVTSTDNLAQKVVVIDDLGNIAHIDKSTLFIPLQVKDPVAAATTANVTLSGEQTIDTVALVTGDRVLVWKQTDSTENGIYSVSTGTWTRVTDTDSWEEFIQAYTLALGGSENLNVGFFCTAATGGTLGTDAIHWVQFTRPGEFSVSNVGTGVEVYKGNVGNTFQFRKLKSSNALFTITVDGDSIDFDIDLSDYATIEYVENRIKIYTFNNTTDWTVMAGGYYIDFAHNLAAEVDSEITISGQKVLCNTYAVNNNTLRVTVPADYRFKGQIKINK